MSTKNIILLVIVAAGFLFGVRYLRSGDSPENPDTQKDSTVQLNGQSDPRVKQFTLKILYALKGANAARVKLIDANDKVIHEDSVIGDSTSLSYKDGTRKIVISSRNHDDATILWPNETRREVTMEAKGKFLKRSIELPKTNEAEIIAIKISETKTSQVLADVEVYLDGRLIGTSGPAGTFIATRAELKNAKQMTLIKQGYATNKTTITVGRIDELKIQPVYLNKE